MSKRTREAYFHTYAVFEFDAKGDSTFIKSVANVHDALETAKAVEAWHKCRIVYSCRVKLHTANREWVHGSVAPLRALDSKRRSR